MARPAKPEGEKNIQVSASVTPATHAKLQEIRWDTRTEKLSTVINQAIDEFVAKHGKVDSEAPSSK